jgi:diguanylate cyclase (GGDEF)-like protein
MLENSVQEFSDEAHRTPTVGLGRGFAPGPKRPCLVVLSGAHLGEIFPVQDGVIIGRDEEATLRLLDDEGVSRRHARIIPFGDGGRVIDLESQNGTFVDGERVRDCLLKDGAKIRIGQKTVLKFAQYDAIEEAAQRHLLEAALRDSLTHAFNRRYFLERMGAEIRFADRHNQPLAMLLLDIDHFKQINDRFGHPVGDQVLCSFAELLTRTLRAEDVLARYGGEEFAVLARGIAAPNALLLAERLRKRVSALEFAPKGPSLGLTVSIGVASFPDGPTPCRSAQEAVDRLIARADAALYRAKNSGRNRVEV